jgi:two-component system nitrate/nitrite response regulator NarL
MNPSSDNPIRIVIIDNHTLVRAGLRLILNNQPDMIVIGEAGEPNEGLELVAYKKPDIIVLKLDPTTNIGLEIIRKLFNASNHSRIILLSQLEETQVHLRAVQEGVLGIVLITKSPEIFVKAIQKVHAGEVWIERSMITHLLTGLTQPPQLIAPDPETELVAQLSPRERKVIQLLGQGLKNKVIAKHLSLSETTVRHHLTSIYSKLGVSDRLELLVFAHRNGLE